MNTVEIFIEGKVQGVFFRASAKKVADALQLTGWVKNTLDSAVAITATGDAAALEALIAWCKKGPEKAVVTNVRVTRSASISFNGFVIKK